MSERQDDLTREEARERARLIGDLAYDVSFDLTNADGFHAETVVTFSCREPGAAAFIDFSGPAIEHAELNGAAIPAEAFDGYRLALEGLAERNELRVTTTGEYHRNGIGMCRFVDPVDDRVYLHTDFEPFDAHRAFPCFDQPDLKGAFRFSVLAPSGWEVTSNEPPDGPPEEHGGGLRWRFLETRPIPTYITVILAGEYHVVRDRHHDIELALYARRSLAPYVESDDIFAVTKQGLDFFSKAFDYEYPFTKYDQAFVPEFTGGAMENAGCVTFNESYLFRSRVTRTARVRRAETILHEMAHMWFGDLVTMRWWNDLWLNESFATYASYLAMVSATEFTDAWTNFATVEKPWAYQQDQLPTTHPIVAEVPDVLSVHVNFDGITYAKGASVLRQLVAWVGEDRFLEGMRAYFRQHEWGNTELTDFLAALEKASGRDLRTWSDLWLETAGVNTLRPAVQGGNGAYRRFAIGQEAPEAWPTIRPHRLAVGLYDLTGDVLSRRRRAELDVEGTQTEVADLEGEAVPDLAIVNDDDLTYAKVRFDPRSLDTVIAHLGDLDASLARAVCWTALWDMTRDGELPARDFLRAVLANVDRDDDIAIVQTLLAQANGAVILYGDPANRTAAFHTLARQAQRMMEDAAAGSDHQLSWARAFASAARTPEELGLVRDLLSGSTTIDGLAVDTDFRWHLVRCLAARGLDDGLIDAELERDATDLGRRHAAAARAAGPTPTAKAEAWATIVDDHTQPLSTLVDVMAAFQQADQEEVLRPYAERFFETLPRIWSERPFRVALAFAKGMFPHLLVEPETRAMADRYLGSGEVPAPIARLVVEGRDGIDRALRARGTDAAAEAQEGRSGAPAE